MAQANSHDEFELGDKEFYFIADFIRKHAGIELSDAKRHLVYGRLVRRLRQLGLGSFGDYCKLLRDDPEGELEHCANALSTNLTSFFREPHHFEYLASSIVPALRQRGPDVPVLCWSAGCSTGEEPYSIAMTLAETLPASYKVRILATDLDSNVVATGESGIYKDERITGISEERRKRWFMRGKGAKSGMIRVRRELREMVTFRKLNLLDPWPMRNRFDFIFCRNVIIYFSKETQATLFSRFHELLRPSSVIFIGHSESLYKVTDQFQLIGQTIYRRVD
ncbi:MAG: protein-glutamate O-methyltransferase CheR [Wenzhouxiangellaceae bacterium]|nr:protein-glutamate O-methyltransferase CheR [Wenzhouxiangellaceae bacterium]